MALSSGNHTWDDRSDSANDFSIDTGGDSEIDKLKERITQLENNFYNLKDTHGFITDPVNSFNKLNKKDYEPGKSYEKGDLLIYNNEAYKSESNFTASSISNDIKADNIVQVGDSELADSEYIFYDNSEYSTVEAALDALLGGGSGVALGDAESIGYEHPDYNNVEEALNSILYVNPQVSLNNNVNVVEKGTTVTEVTLSWSYNKSMESISLSDDIGEIDVSKNSYNIPGLNITEDKSWTATVSDGENTDKDNTSISFMQKVFSGVSEKDSLTSKDILELSNSRFSNSYKQTKTFDCSGGKYIYFAYPARFGTPSDFIVGGLSSAFDDLGSVSHTNESGYEEDYKVYRSTNMQNGSEIKVEVK